MKRSENTSIALLVLLLLTHPCAAQETKERKVTPPKWMEYDEKVLRYDPSWQDKEIYIEANIDDDPEEEVIIGFVAFYKPEEKNKDVVPFTVPEKVLIPLEYYVFYQIYDSGIDGHYKLVKSLSGMDRLGKIEIFKVAKDSPPVLAILSPGGESYTDLCVYQWREGGYRLLLSEGTSQAVTIDASKLPPVIQIGPDAFLWKDGFKKEGERTKNKVDKK